MVLRAQRARLLVHDVGRGDGLLPRTCNYSSANLQSSLCVHMIVDHAHIALLGTFSFIAMGAIYYIIPVTLKRRIYSPGVAEAQFWLITVGFLLMMLSLQIGGLLQGAAWLNGDSVYKVLPSLKP